MEKKEALGIIYSAVEAYDANLLNCNFLFVHRSGNELLTFETVFLKRNFFHLTGVFIDEKAIVSANSFYNICLRKRLRQDEFDFYPDGTTVKKLEVIKRLMELPSCAHMIGYYNGSNLHLKTDRIIGNVFACLGFVFDDQVKHFVPNTALKVDCRDVIAGSPITVQAILKKSNQSHEYNEICSIRKTISIDKLNALERVNVQND